MMNPMAGRTRLFVAVAAGVLIAMGCSSDGDTAAAELESVESSTTTTEATTTTSTIATTTTLSEQAQAEADVAQLVTDYWLTEIDTSKGQMGQEFLTGLIAQRTEEVIQRRTEAGQILRDRGQKRIEVLEVDVSVQDEVGEARACMGSASEIVDAATFEPIGDPGDPDILSINLFVVQHTESGWKIGDFFPSIIDGSPELCEIGE